MALLQRFGFGESRYERPNQDWVCGRAAEGRACNAGPSPKGACHATFECLPNRKGDRWHCTRDALAGGKCKEGPRPDGQCARRIPPCLPVRSLRARRGRAARWVLLATLGGLLLLLAGPLRLELVSAGALGFAHGASATDCSDCHTAPHGDLGGWLKTAFSPPSGVEESRLCLDCHRLGDAALGAHSLPPPTLETLTERATQAHGEDGALRQRVLGVLGLGVPTDADGALACATCHREHQGQQSDITALSDAECQGCHVVRFDSLGDGHPEIGGYAFDRRTPIVFDHISHKDKHYPEEEQDFVCATCHVPDLGGQSMLVTPFEDACADCHGAQIEGEGQAGDKGIPVLRVPGLDLFYVRDHDVPIGEWPQGADAELAPLMRLLLSSDPAFVASAERLDRYDLLDLAEADAAIADDLAVYAWAVKSLFHDLLTGGQQALGQRLAAVLGEPLDTAELSALAGLLPPQVIRTAQQAWFPHLEEEMARHGRGEPVPYVDTSRPAPSDAGEEGGDTEPLEDGGDILGGDGGDILGDEDASGDILGGDGDGILGDEDAGGDGGDILGDEDAGGDILGGGNAGGDILGDEDAGGDILGDDDAGGDILGEDAALGGDPFAAEEPAPTPRAAPVSGEEWVRAGGWYRQYFTLLYRPSGHQDRFLSSWLGLTASTPEAARPELAQAVFARLGDPKGPGLCTKCHSVDAHPAGGVSVNWTARRPVPDQHRFTEFSHVAHLSLLDQEGCLLCHTWAEEPQGEFLDAYQGTDPKVRHGNFAAFEKATCTACHQPRMAGDACLTCHNYHVGLFPPGEVLVVQHDEEQNQ